MSYNGPPFTRAAKVKILEDLRRMLDEVLEAPSYGDFYAGTFHDDSWAGERPDPYPICGGAVSFAERKGRR
jgi:hypothetical protein